MANSLYPIWKKALLDNTSGSSLNAAEGTTGVYAVLIDTDGYIYSDAPQFYSEVLALSPSPVVGTATEITTKTTTGGIFDGDNVTFSSVTGPTVEALIIFRQNAGANTTWQLVAYIDTGVTGLPVTPNGGDITVTWNASGIFEV
jgi:hypothetical protein